MKQIRLTIQEFTHDFSILCDGLITGDLVNCISRGVGCYSQLSGSKLYIVEVASKVKHAVTT